jgi:integrase
MSQPKLLEQVRSAIRLRHYSRRTEEAYVRWVRRFVLFHGKMHPSTLASAEITAFLSHLAVREKVAAATQNQALNAILFLYRLLEQPFPELERVARAQRPAKLPSVFTPEEVRQILAQMKGVNGLVAQLLYRSGLRLLEGLRLRVKDIQFSQLQITVREGKRPRPAAASRMSPSGGSYAGGWAQSRTCLYTVRSSLSCRCGIQAVFVFVAPLRITLSLGSITSSHGDHQVP